MYQKYHYEWQLIIQRGISLNVYDHKAGHCPTLHAIAVSLVPIQIFFDFLLDLPLPFRQKAADSFCDRNIRIPG